ncbi:S8 family serine peptidase [Longimicrobium sp.]|uniref:S8 family serine peptidase n=1 Tax=Longimicrobium sp. TaxID=2029185 RepID=UPI002B6AF758|nr:S8 family serine peptidase [Longimicrobium sp.]HSU13766.1 S8 family serine peptidase [Longimicrobium sp.]
MRNKWLHWAAASLLVALAACADEVTRPDLRAPQASRTSRRGDVVPDRYIVVFRETVGDAPGLARQLVAAHGGTRHYTYQHALKGFAATLPSSAIEALRHNPNVAYVEPDRVAALDQTAQPSPVWNLDRVDQRRLPMDGTYYYAWAGAGVTAYIIDTGIQTSHPEFGGRAQVGYDAFGGNGQDCTGHGTHVAGTVGGATYGVAKAVKLVSVRVFECTNTTTWSAVIAGIDWVRLHHQTPAVANLSLGGAADSVVDAAVRNLIASGITVVVSAGNDAADACNYSPARVAEALTVGATDQTDQRTSFSNIGSCLDVFAPGMNITSAWINGGSNTINGTSMAAPHATGHVALFLQEKPAATTIETRDRVVANATPGLVTSAGAASPNRLLNTRLGRDYGARSPVHRTYQPYLVDHSYSLAPGALDYPLEKLDYFYTASDSSAGHIPLYRCRDQTYYNRNLLSVNGSCGIFTQGVLQGYIATSQVTGTVPLYRVYHPGYHDNLYTKSITEVQDKVANAGYVDKGIIGYVYNTPSP